MPSGIKEILKRFRKVMTVEGTWADRPDEDEIDRRGQPPLRAAGDDAALAHAGRRRLLDRSRGQPIKPGMVVNAIRAKLAE